jgi:hypothetical protein
MKLRAVLVVVFLGGCHAPSPSPSIRPEPSPASQPAEIVVHPTPPCAIERWTTIIPGERGRVTVVAALHNADVRAHTLTLPGVCPGGLARFTGLPDGSDPYGTCAMGACAGPIEAHTLTLAPGKTETIARVEIDPAGSACMAPLAPGRYALGFEVVLAGAESCLTRSATFEVAGAVAPPPRRRDPVPEVRREVSPERPSARCPPMPACGIGCPGPLARDENGCTLCACEPDPFGPPSRVGR